MSAQHIEQDWVTAAGLRAVVLMTSMGHRCGYVGVPAGHPLHGSSYSKPSPALVPVDENTQIGKRSLFAVLASVMDVDRMQAPEMVFDVHGGLTYSDNSSIYPAPSDGLWWFGYDCGHHGDSPSDDYIDEQRGRYPDKPYMWPERDGVHRSLSYCAAECESLARQIVEATGSTHV